MDHVSTREQNKKGSNMIIQIIASANGAKDYFHKSIGDVNQRAANDEAARLQIQLKNMLNAQNQSPVFEFQDDDMGEVLINVKSYNFITARVIEEHKM